MCHNSTELGKRAEAQACRYLQAHGLTLQCANYSCKLGEIDLIMQDRSLWVFVEVRYRRTAAYGTALATVDRAKQRKIVRTATCYLQKLRCYGKVACRFDIITLAGPNLDAIQWIKDAFGDGW